MFKSIKNFKASYPYPLEYPIKIVTKAIWPKGWVAWVYQKFCLPIDNKKDLVINERILECPIAHEWLGKIIPDANQAKILEIGHVASQFSLELASIGYQVTAIDLRDYPFSHKNLISLKGDFLKYNFSEKFNAVVSLSVIEHFGLSQRYGGENIVNNHDDELAFAKIAQVLVPGGYTIISVPYARTFRTDIWFRVYTREDVEKKLSQFFTIEDKKYYKRKDNSWSEATPQTDPVSPHDGVAMFLLKKLSVN